MPLELEDDWASFEAALSFLEEYGTTVQTESDQIHGLVKEAENEEEKADKQLLQASQTANSLVTAYVSNSTSELAADGQLALSLAAEQLQSLNSNPEIPVKKTRKNANRARNERKQELIYLRNKVQTMEQELRELRRKSVAASSEYDGNDAKCFSGDKGWQPRSGCDSSQQIWKAVAARQSEQRMESERENIRLKLVLESQIKIAKSLEKILKKRSTLRSNEGMEACTIGKRMKRVHQLTAVPSDNDVFSALLSGVEQLYQEVDDIFATNGLDRMEIPFSDKSMRDSADGMYLEMLSNQILPFNVDAANSAVWQHFTNNMQHMPYRFYYQKESKKMEAAKDTIVENMGLELQSNNTKANFRVKQILRRYIEKDRVVIVWRAFITPVEFSDEPLVGIQFDEKGYIILQQAKTMSSEYTVMKRCHILTPQFVNGLMSHQDARTGALTDFVLSTTAANIAASHRMIENVLLAQSMQKR